MEYLSQIQLSLTCTIRVTSKANANMHKWANVCIYSIYSKFIQLTFSSVYMFYRYIHTYSKYSKVTTENMSMV